MSLFQMLKSTIQKYKTNIDVQIYVANKKKLPAKGSIEYTFGHIDWHCPNGQFNLYSFSYFRVLFTNQI